MRVEIKKGRASGEINAPPSKSVSHRLMIGAALAEGVSVVRGVSRCDDVLATVDCLSALGVRFEWEGEDVIVHGIDAKCAKAREKLCCRESGSTLRFLLPIAWLSGNEVVLSGAESLMKRPMEVYECLAQEKGLIYKKENDEITVQGVLAGVEYSLRSDVSSQFISGLLFALPLAKGDSVIKLEGKTESRSYINLTLDTLSKFGVRAEWKDDRTLFVKGGQKYTPADVTVEGDASGAAFTEALNLFGGSVKISGLDQESLQGDGVYRELFEKLSLGTPTLSIADCPDLAPILFSVAAAKNGGKFLDTARLKIKESNRAEAMAAELRKFGAEVEVGENSVVVTPKEFHAPDEVLKGHGDHRVVMALSMLCTLTGGEIEGAEAVSKSYPEFFEHLRQLGISVTEKN